MAMSVIELPDDQAAALNAKAASEGLTLTELLRKLAEPDLSREVGSAKNAVERILEL
jgi:uncharacterized protein YjgD (DUF1641 family)